MKILLDECLPTEFRHYFPNHEVHSAEWAGLKGKKNGELIRGCEAGGYAVILTIDQGIPFQQQLAGRTLSFVVIRSRSGKIEALAPFVSVIETALQTIAPGQVLIVESHGA